MPIYKAVCQEFVDPEKPHTTYPKLKGRGAEIRDLVHPLLLTFQEFQRPNNENDGLVVQMLEYQVSLQRLLADHDRRAFLPTTEAARVLLYVESILQLYSRLAKMADDNDQCIFNIVPTHNFLWHFAYKARYLNPRKGNCMIDEDFVGVMKNIVRS